MLISRAEIDGRGPRDVRLAGGRIAVIADRLTPDAGEPVLDAAGGALLPGLHDHHLHLFALAAAAASVPCGPPAVKNAAGLARALAAAPVGGDWVRGVGYHESVAGPLDRSHLDRLVGARPARVQHRSGMMWMLSSAAVARLGLDDGVDAPGVERDRDGRATGRLIRLDDWLRARLGDGGPPGLAAVGTRLARAGVTGVTDATVTNGAAELAALEAAIADGTLPQRLVVMGSLALPEPARREVARGAVKIVLDDHALPALATIESTIAAARAQARPVAVHCVSRAALVLAVTAFAAAGARPGDRLEHAAVAPPEALALVARLPLTIVTQPGLVYERGDAYRREVDETDRPWLYRLRGIRRAGVALGGGTDAPFGDPDPWRAMRAAVDRRTASGAALGADEALTPEQALGLFTSPPAAPGGPSRAVTVGAPADLCLLDRPWRGARRELTSAMVRATVRDGAVIWPRP